MDNAAARQPGQVFQQVTTPMLQLAPDLRVRHCNDAAKLFFIERMDLLSEAVPGIPWDAICGADFRSFFVEPDAQAALLANPKNLPYTETFWLRNVALEIGFSTRLDSEGQPDGVTLEFRDVTLVEELQADAMASRDLVLALQFASEVGQLPQVVVNTLKQSLGWDLLVYRRVDPDGQTEVIAQAGGLAHPGFEAAIQRFSLGKLGASSLAYRLSELQVTQFPDDMADGRVSEAAEQAGLTVAIVIPVEVSDRVTGLIELYDAGRLEPSISRIESLRGVGFMVSGTLRRMVETEAAEESRQLTAAVNSVLMALQRVDSRRDAMQKSVAAMREAFGWDYAMFWCCHGPGGRANFMADAGDQGEFEVGVLRGHPVEIGFGVVGEAWMNQKTVATDNLGRVRGAFEAAARRVGFQSAVAMPVQCGEHTQAVIVLFSKEKRLVNGETREVMASVGRIAAQVLLRAREQDTQMEAQQALDQTIAMATQGDLSGWLNTDAWGGVLKTIGEGINQLLRIVEKPLMEHERVAIKLGEGDLCQRVNIEEPGVFRRSAQSVNSAIGRLDRTLRQMTKTSARVHDLSITMRTQSINLSERTFQQAAALEETTAIVEEITSSVARTADNARNTQDMAVEARDLARHGLEVAERAELAIREVAELSERVRESTRVIDEIAFRTNLLALNAAVEAARAGTLGSGFAVVAAEVRGLSERSAVAAGSIAELVKSASLKMEEGKKAVTHTRKRLQDISQIAKRVSDTVQEIAVASTEQARGVEEINSALAQVDNATRRNAEMAELKAELARELANASQALQASSDNFKLSADGEMKPVSPPGLPEGFLRSEAPLT